MKNLKFVFILFFPVLIYIKSTKKYRANIPSDFFGFMTRPNDQAQNHTYDSYCLTKCGNNLFPLFYQTFFTGQGLFVSLMPAFSDIVW